MYKCQSVLKEHQPPPFSVQDVDTVCEDAVNNTLCRYNCNGILQDKQYTLREQNVKLYEYSSTDQVYSTIYQCRTPIKYILRAHGVMLVNEAKVTLTDDGSKFTLFTYTNQGECLPAAQREFDMGCDDSIRDPLYTFSSEFYEVGFSYERERTGISAVMGLVECSGNSDSLRNRSILTLIDGYRANQPNYRDMINYYTLNTTELGYDDIFTSFGLNSNFKLSELVRALKVKHPGRDIHLHLATCLSTDQSFTPQIHDPLPPLTSRWVNIQTNLCNDLPVCDNSYLNLDSVDISECGIGYPSSVSYSIEGNRYIQEVSEKSTCNLTCKPEYSKNIDGGFCMTYQKPDGTTSTKYLRIKDETLYQLDINCIPVVNVCSSL